MNPGLFWTNVSKKAEGKTIKIRRDRKSGQSSRNYIRLYKH
jgi:hypothetical protein